MANICDQYNSFTNNCLVTFFTNRGKNDPKNVPSYSRETVDKK